MSPYRSREAPVPGSSVSETHPGFWADHIRHETSINNRWYNDYGRFYYKKPYDESEPPYGPINAYVSPLKERRYLLNGRVSPSQPVAYLKACLEEKKMREAAAQVCSARAVVSCKSPLQLSYVRDGYESFYGRLQYPGSSRDCAHKLHCTCSCVPLPHCCTDKSCVTSNCLPVATKLDRHTGQQHIDVPCIPLNKNAHLAECYTDNSEARISSFLSKTWDGRSCLRKDELVHKEAGGPCYNKQLQRSLNDSLLQKCHPSSMICGPGDKGFHAPKSSQALYSCMLHGDIRSSGVTDKGEPSASIAKCAGHAIVDKRSRRKPQQLRVADVLTWHEPWHAAQEGKRGT